MSESTHPAHHPDPEVDAAHGYVSAVVDRLAAAGHRVPKCWLDPKGPVDATVLTEDFALVWDEWTGWRMGTYVSGRQGERTVLRDAVLLGGGVLPTPASLVRSTWEGPRPSVTTRDIGARDGLFDALRVY
ncbi:DUF6292 family protein [Actinomadura kijaniata]|uniref:DUF6292 family protein n=1 Tax=Actinomadura kijaniata TaxID=46161 RepID=UPI003F19ABE9